ncbi:MAG TPA: hypothetical protein VJG90_02175 [Candidatus Nanoarchaeia archaeon]|nr:hypothetical protein [Candidatus Nanoarchaeia archaeon]
MKKGETSSIQFLMGLIFSLGLIAIVVSVFLSNYEEKPVSTDSFKSLTDKMDTMRGQVGQSVDLTFEPEDKGGSVVLFFSADTQTLTDRDEQGTQHTYAKPAICQASCVCNCFQPTHNEETKQYQCTKTLCKNYPTQFMDAGFYDKPYHNFGYVAKGNEKSAATVYLEPYPNKVLICPKGPCRNAKFAHLYAFDQDFANHLQACYQGNDIQCKAAFQDLSKIVDERYIIQINPKEKTTLTLKSTEIHWNYELPFPICLTTDTAQPAQLDFTITYDPQTFKLTVPEKGTLQSIQALKDQVCFVYTS